MRYPANIATPLNTAVHRTPYSSTSLETQAFEAFKVLLLKAYDLYVSVRVMNMDVPILGLSFKLEAMDQLVYREPHVATFKVTRCYEADMR